jgi:hypothetical protein
MRALRPEDSTGCSGLRYADYMEPESGGAPIATTDRCSLPHGNDERKPAICA